MFSFGTLFYVSAICAWLCLVAIFMAPNPVVYFFFIFNIINAIMLYFLVKISEKQKERKAKKKVKVEDLKPND